MLILGVHLRLSLQQQLDALQMTLCAATLGRPHERGLITPIGSQHVAARLASGRQHLLQRVSVATSTGRKQVVPCIVLSQHCNSFLVPVQAGPTERREANVARVQICAF